jgi:hypothetical protein
MNHGPAHSSIDDDGPMAMAFALVQVLHEKIELISQYYNQPRRMDRALQPLRVVAMALLD